MYQCFKCGLNYDTVDNLQKHFTFGGHIVDKYVCRQLGCILTFDFLKSFVQHLRNVHGTGIVEPEPQPAPENDIQINVNNQHPDNGVQNNVVADEQEVAEPVGPVTLQDFTESICRNAAVLAARLDSLPNVNRENVSTFIAIASDFFQNGLVFSLKEKVLRLLAEAVDFDEAVQDQIFEIGQMFDMLSDPFETVSSEYKRLKSAESDGRYIKPERYLLCHNDVYRREDDNVVLVREPSYGQFVPSRKVLKAFFEAGNGSVFHAVVNYVNSLQGNRTVIKNFVQGELWQELLTHFEGETVFPIDINFDDYELNNSQGSHSGDHELGACYLSIPCLPPHMCSSVENMFSATQFLSKNRKECGNAIAFGPLIDELIFLYEQGIQLKLPTGDVNIRFCLCRIKADNKGNNTIQGFVESFRANYYCRLCKMHRDAAMYHTAPVPHGLFRNAVNYDFDIATNDFSATGLKERCVFNRVPLYHVTKNISCDMLHDISEGIVKYGLNSILYSLIIERGYLTVELLQDRMDSFDYGPSELGNKPPSSHVTQERLQAKNINLSGSEMLCLVRYLGLMIGDLVPVQNRVWEFYLVLREITEIVSAHYHVPGTDVYLGNLIQEHHEQYVALFGPLKPKHHFTSHAAQQMRINGPLSRLDTLTSERKHRQGKLYARAMNSRINPPLSISIKLQLELSEHLLHLNGAPHESPQGVKKCRVQQLPNFQQYINFLPFHVGEVISTAKSVSSHGTVYKKNMIVVVSVHETYPTFGKIVCIIQDGVQYKFVINVLRTVCYQRHFCAYEVENSDHYIYVSQSDFISYVPLWARLSVMNGATMVALKCAV